MFGIGFLILIIRIMILMYLCQAIGIMHMYTEQMEVCALNIVWNWNSSPSRKLTEPYYIYLNGNWDDYYHANDIWGSVRLV